jgi:hypothetical protein
MTVGTKLLCAACLGKRERKSVATTPKLSSLENRSKDDFGEVAGSTAKIFHSRRLILSAAKIFHSRRPAA